VDFDKRWCKIIVESPTYEISQRFKTVHGLKFNTRLLSLL
jgi:hypothetical protein